MALRLHPFSLALTILLARPAIAAEVEPAPGSDEPVELGTVAVSASALAVGSDAMSTPVTMLDGDQLVLRRAATLGETLAAEPGIRATQFGASASRPIIRGMDGARVKVLSDGAEVMDASTISPDHAVAVEPMLSERIEVLRGPSALAYGGGAIGGVVNLLDSKIPTAIPVRGVEGSVELRANSAAREASGAFEVTAGAGSIAIHAEGLKRDARDYRVGDGWPGGSEVDDSYNQTGTGSLGLSWIGERGHLGIAWTRQRNEYGLPGHVHDFEDCHTHGDHLHCGGHGHEHDHAEHGGGAPYVDLDSKRWDLRGEYLEPFAGFARIRLRASTTDYRHDEIEDGTVATRFRNQANDGRIELEHHPLGGWRGVFGLQHSRRDFSALGKEAYLQPTLTHRNGAFLIEEYQFGDWRFEAGLRHERQHIDVDSNARDRSHHGNSLSFGTVWNFTPQYAATLSLSRTQRLPTAEELYADGLHMATRTLERGNPDLKAETAQNIDIGLKNLSGATIFSIGAFYNRVSDFIYARTLDEHDGLQLIKHDQRDAIFTGIEGQIRRQLNAMFGLTLFGDYVRARLASGDGDRDLPRIPAHRIGLRLDMHWNGWEGEAELYRVGSQHKIAAFETGTAGYNMLNLSASRAVRIDSTDWLFYVKASNLTDGRAYSHTSFIKDAAPLMGRNLTVGVKMVF